MRLLTALGITDSGLFADLRTTLGRFFSFLAFRLESALGLALDFDLAASAPGFPSGRLI